MVQVTHIIVSPIESLGYYLALSLDWASSWFNPDGCSGAPKQQPAGKLLSTRAIFRRLGTYCLPNERRSLDSFICFNACLALFLFVAAPSRATAEQFPPTARQEAVAIQEALIWTGFYQGPLDGKLGSASIAAIERFQATVGRPATGKLTRSQFIDLLRQAHDRRIAAGFSFIVDRATGASIGFPSRLAPVRHVAPNGDDFFSNDGKLKLGLRHYNCNSNIQSVYANLRSDLGFTQIKYSVMRDDWFVISGSVQNKKYYLRFFRTMTGFDGFFAAYRASIADQVSPAIVMLSLTFRPHNASARNLTINACPANRIPLPPEIMPGSARPQISAEQSVPAVATNGMTDAHSETRVGPIYLNSNNDSKASKLLLDTIQLLISRSTHSQARFFRYVVDKSHLKGFKSSMPVLRIVFPERVFFDTDKSKVRADAESTLNAVARTLRNQTSKFALFVAGYTDSRGSVKYNLDLSMRRANSVARALVSRGVGPALIWRIGFGKAFPLKPNTTPQNMAYNRRVEFLIARKAAIIAEWVNETKSLCENGIGSCRGAHPQIDLRAIPVGRRDLKPIMLRLPARRLLTSAAKQFKERPPLPALLLTRPSLQDLER